jgi:hypothetical protein
LDGFLSFATALLDLAEELLQISFSFGEIIVGDLCLLANYFTLELMPIALKFIVIHSSLILGLRH